MTDKLARIEERAVASGFTAVYPPADVLALVNIAKAARPVIEEYDEPIEGTEGASETEFHDRVEALRAALDGAR